MRGSHRPISTDHFRARNLLAAAIWATQFLILSGFALTGSYPHPLAGSLRRLSIAAFGALLCIAIAWMLDRAAPVAASRRFSLLILCAAVAALTWSLFVYSVIHLIPGDEAGARSIGIGRELALNGLAGGSLFALWLAGCLVLDDRKALSESRSRSTRKSESGPLEPIFPPPAGPAGTAEARGVAGGAASCKALWVSVRGGKERLPLDMIEYFEADHDYVRVHAKSGRHLLYGTLEAVHRDLEPGGFLRVHRSFIVNLAEVAQLRRRPGGLFELALTSGARLPVGRTYSGSVRKRLLSRGPRPS
ncbi:MAG TPA: LytTR family transcriptional regulator DNA-binding domain-containing protein [Allosphingosinicella sp.]|jgi:hypothetical protein